VNVDEYKKGQGGWLRSEDVELGDVLTILSAGYLDDETFQDKAGKPKQYYCTDMRLLRTGAEKKVRLGSENVKRIAEAFGDDTTTWVKKDVVVDDVKTYKGLGKKGIIFKPVKESATQTTPITPTEQAPLTPGKEPIMTRGEALEKSKNWPAEDREAWLNYLKAQGKLRD